MGTTGSYSTEIQVKGLYKSFDENLVLRGVDLTINQGDIIAMVGGSGCGKTVLLNHILGLMTADSGAITITDHDSEGTPLVDMANINASKLDKICAHWGVVFQKNALFSGSVYDNISLWLREIKNLKSAETKTIVCSVLHSVGLPFDGNFLDTDVNDLSGGMAKRLATARALAMNPAVIFYDEPTTGLDPTSALQIHDLILGTHKQGQTKDQKRTTVIITHDKDLLSRIRPRIAMLHEGKTYFDGPLDDFEKSASKIIRPYFDIMPLLHQKQTS